MALALTSAGRGGRLHGRKEEGRRKAGTGGDDGLRMAAAACLLALLRCASCRPRNAATGAQARRRRRCRALHLPAHTTQAIFGAASTATSASARCSATRALAVRAA
jgi:hypothetical protein